MRARLRRKPDSQIRVREEHVLFPLGVAELVATVACRRLQYIWLIAPEREGPDERAVEPDLQLVGGSHAADVVDVVPMQSNREIVFTRHREVMSDADPATRAERKVVAHPVVLYEENGHVVGLGCR